MGITRRVALRPEDPELPAPAAYDDGEEAYAQGIAQPLVSAGELEAAAVRVAGVRACRIERHPDAPTPDRVRVVADRERCSAVAKDIQSAWFALWGLYVPRRVFAISVVAPGDDLGPRRLRAQLREIRAESGDGTLRVVVVLSSRGRRLVGEASQPQGGTDAPRLAATAVLHALRPLLPANGGADLLDFRRIQVGGLPALVCAVGLGAGRILCGICEVGGDERLAAARVVLDALNRSLGG
jgi:hypothetical protein